MIFIDKINKILWITSHKTGISTISTYLMNLYFDNKYTDGYYVNELINLGLCEYKEEYKDYHKVFIFRDPYKRFISAFLQDIYYAYNMDYYNKDIPFYDYCLFLKNNYDKSNINYLEYNGIFYDLNHNLTDNNCSSIFSNLLITNLRTVKKELYNDLNLLEFKIDESLNLDDLSNYLKNLNRKNSLDINIIKSNVKTYDKNLKINAFNINLCEFARNINKLIPTYEYFYNEEIKSIVNILYKEDFDLYKEFGIDNATFNFNIPKINDDCYIQKNQILNYKYKSNNPNHVFLILQSNFTIKSLFEMLNSIIKYNINIDIYIFVDSFYFIKYSEIFNNTNIFFINSNYSYKYELTDKLLVDKYLEMYSSIENKYENIIIYHTIPVFVSNLIDECIEKNKLTEQTFNNFDLLGKSWYFYNEVKKDFDKFNYEKYYLMNYNGLCFNNDSFITFFTKMKELVDKIEGKYPIFVVLSPIILRENMDNISLLDDECSINNGKKIFSNYITIT